MNGRIPRRIATLAVAMLAAVGAIAVTAGAASASEVVYNNVPSPLPGNFASYGNEAYSMQELGGEVELAGAARKNPKVTVVMSSWACQSGGVYQDTCETAKPNKKFKWPVTLNLYDVGPGNTLGAKIGSTTKTFAMPYRPTRNDAVCVPLHYEAGTWYDAATGRCYHGMAFAITFKPVHIELRQKVIVSVSYNTTDHGPAPVGTAPCNTSSGGCYYDALNVAIAEPSEKTLTLGAQPTEDIFVNSTYSEMFCESGTAGTFGPAGCSAFWEGAQPVIAVSAN
ncbi:MAG: hypothetical protein ABSG93_20255 [Solirubrobacteraceae bacterium]